MLKRITTLGLFTVLIFTQCDNGAQQLQEFETAFDQEQWQNCIDLSGPLLRKDACNDVVLSKLARAYSNLNRDKEAMQWLNKAIECHPEITENYGYRGNLRLKMKSEDYAAILSDVNISLTEHPENERQLQLQALMYFNLGQPINAIQSSKALIRVNSKNSDGYTLASRSYEMLQKPDSALKVLKLGLLMVPNSIHLNEDMGYYFLTHESYDTAITYFDKVISSTPNDELEEFSKALAYNNRGFCYYQQEQYDIALKDIDTSIQLLNNNAFAYKNRALVYIAHGEIEKACTDLQKAVQLNFTKYYGSEVEDLMAQHCL